MSHNAPMDIYQIIRLSFPMSDEGIEMIVPYLKPRHVKRGECLFVRGERTGCVFIIRKGIFRNFTEYDGKVDTRYFALDGDLVTSMFSFYADLPSMSTMEALTAAEIWEVPFSAINELIAHSHEWAQWRCSLLKEQLYAMERRYTYVGAGDAYTRYVNFMKMRPMDMIKQIPLNCIASYLKITPQTLSRLRRKYVREK